MPKGPINTTVNRLMCTIVNRLMCMNVQLVGPVFVFVVLTYQVTPDTLKLPMCQKHFSAGVHL